jgi:uncharacterized protein (TIGR02996 family)
MSDRAGFIQAILDDLDNDLPRMVYGDWLEERGEPHGELIRLQCRLRHLAPGSPEAAALKQRESELLNAHAEQWLGPLTQRQLFGAWDRGFVLSVPLNCADFATYAPRLAALPVVLDFTVNQAGPPLYYGIIGENAPPRPPSPGCEPLLRSPCLDRITTLDCQSDPNNQGHLYALFSNPALGRLRNLSLQGMVGWDVLRAICQTAKRLRALNIRLEPDQLNFFVQLPFVAQLEYLVLKGSVLRCTADALLASPYLTGLRKLTMFSPEPKQLKRLRRHFGKRLHVC